MASVTQNKNMNEFMIMFLTEHASDALDMWNSEENQTEFSQVLNRIAKTSKAAGKKNSNKDPSKPKRGSSAYIFFCSETRSQIKQDHPEFDAKQVTAELGVRWTTLKEEDQDAVEKYNAMAAADKARYELEMESYVPSSEESSGEDKPKKRKASKKTTKSGKEKDPSKPKRGKSAYLFFCAKERSSVLADNPDMSPKEVIAELSVRWTTLKAEDEEGLAIFTQMAVEDKARYEEDIKGWTGAPESKPVKAPKAKASKATEAETEEAETEEELEEEEDKPAAKPAAKPAEEKPAEEKTAAKSLGKKKTTGYIIFCQEHRQQVKDDNTEMKAGDITKELSRLWKELDTVEQQVYKDRAEE